MIYLAIEEFHVRIQKILQHFRIVRAKAGFQCVLSIFQ